MAEKRKAIPKRIRFEVFKRDKFTCQYCGKMAPEVVLEVDHIKPVSKGGSNELLNLITSCQDCNRGKSNIELSDDSVVKRQQAQLQEIAERKEQLEMMLEWRESLKDLTEDYIDAVNDIFESATPWVMNETGRKKVKKWIKEFSLEEVLDATEIALDYYYTGSSESWNIAFNKIPGICYINRTQKDNPQLYYANYTIKALRNKGCYCDDTKIKRFFKDNEISSDDFEEIKLILKESKNWTYFRQNVEQSLGLCI